MEITSSTASALSPDVVGQLRNSNLSPAAQGKAVAQQFEAILMRQFLDKSIGSMMGSGAGSDVYGYMLTDVLSQKLAQGGGLGMASILERQFTPAGAQPDAAAPAKGTS